MVDPGIRNVGNHFALEILLDAFLERDRFGVAQFGVGLRVSPAITADLGRLVAFTKGCDDSLKLRRRETDASLVVRSP